MQRSGFFASSEPGSEKLNARIFISYSRKDIDVAEQIREALHSNGFDAFLDLHDISPGEPWQERLKGLIASADKIVFLISPYSVASKVCAWEVDTAEEQAKGILPVQIAETKLDTIPGRLRRLNILMMRSEEERADGLAKLMSALAVDLDWEREKTRINDDAVLWQAEGRPRRRLMARQDAIGIAEDWRDNWPPTAAPPTELQREFISKSRQHHTRRQRRILTVVLIGILVTGLLAVVALVAGRAATIKASEARAERDQTLLVQSRFLAGFARDALAEGDAIRASAIALGGLPTDPTEPDARPLEPSAVRVLNHARFARRATHSLRGHTGAITSVSFDKEGKRLLTTSTDGTARVWDVKTGDQIAVRGPRPDRSITPERNTAALRWARFAPDGESIVTLGDWNGEVHYWSLSPNEIKGHAVYTTSEDDLDANFDMDFVQFNEAGTLIAHNELGKIRYFDLDAGQHRDVLDVEVDGIVPSTPFGGSDFYYTKIEEGSQKIYHGWSQEIIGEIPVKGEVLAVSKNADRVVAMRPKTDDPVPDMIPVIYQLRSGQELSVLNTNGAPVYSARFAADNSYVALHLKDENSARVYSSEDGAELATLDGHSDFVDVVALSPDGHVVTASSDGTVRAWNNPPYFYEREIFKGGFESPGDLVISPDGAYVAVSNDTSFGSGGEDIIRILKINAPALGTNLPGCHSETRGFSRSLEQIRPSPNGKRLLRTRLSGKLCIIDVATGNELLSLTENVNRNAISLDLTRYFALSNGALYEIGIGRDMRRKIADLPHATHQFASSPDGSLVAMASGALKHLLVVDTVKGTTREFAETKIGDLEELRFSRDGSTILILSPEDHRRYTGFRLVDAMTGELIGSRQDLPSQNLAIIRDDGRAMLLDTNQGPLIWNASGTHSLVQLVDVEHGDFSLKGDLILVSATDKGGFNASKHLYILDAGNGDIVKGPWLNERREIDPEFSPDGRHIVVNISDTDVILADAKDWSNYAHLSWDRLINRVWVGSGNSVDQAITAPGDKLFTPWGYWDLSTSLPSFDQPQDLKALFDQERDIVMSIDPLSETERKRLNIDINQGGRETRTWSIRVFEMFQGLFLTDAN